MGVELEIDKDGNDDENAKILLDIANCHDEHMYCKHDGSIDYGFEMVSHPMSLDYHINDMNWLDIFNRAVSLGYRSHNTSTCGLHIHVNRSAFGETHDQQEDVISRIVYFIEAHWNELLKFSRRTEASIMRWASRYGIADNAKLTYDKAKKNTGRYVAVNLANYHTIEFRIFRGLCDIRHSLQHCSWWMKFADWRLFLVTKHLRLCHGLNLRQISAKRISLNLLNI